MQLLRWNISNKSSIHAFIRRYRLFLLEKEAILKTYVNVQGAVMTLGGRPYLSRFGTKNAISKRSILQYVSIDERFFCSKSTKDGLPYVQRECLQTY